MDARKNKNSKLKTLDKIGYASGDFANTMIFDTVGMFLTIFYTDIFGLSTIAVTILFLVARIWDAINDPIMGIIVDKTKSKDGKFRPWLKWGAIPFAVLAVVCFTVPNFSSTGKLIYAYVTYIALGMMYTMINTPYGALASAMTKDPNEAGILALTRVVGARAGGMAVTVAIPIVVGLFDSPVRGYQVVMGAVGIIGAILLYFCYKTTTERYSVPQKTKFSKYSMKLVFKDKAFWILGMMFLLIHANLMITGTAGTYLFKYYFGRESGTSLFNLLGNIFIIISMLILSKMIDKYNWDKKIIFVVGAIGLCVLPISIFFVPATYEGMIVICLIRGIQGIFWGCTLGVIWGMVPDLVNRVLIRTGIRMEGFIYSVMGFAFKIGLTLAGVIPSAILSATGYIANGTQSVAAMKGIMMMNTTLTLMLAVLTIVFGSLYPLNKKKCYEMFYILEEKKEREEAA